MRRNQGGRRIREELDTDKETTEENKLGEYSELIFDGKCVK